MAMRWADADDDESNASPVHFEKLGEDGVKTIVEYAERDGKTYKVTRYVRLVHTTQRSSHVVDQRSRMARFGRALADRDQQASYRVRSEEDAWQMRPSIKSTPPHVKGDEDEFYEKSLATVEALFGKRPKACIHDDKMASESVAGKKCAASEIRNEITTPDAPRKYLPPSVRRESAGQGTGCTGSATGHRQGEEGSLRVSNLADEVTEGGLRELFGSFGRLQRVYVGRDPATQLCKGWAFVTFNTVSEAENALKALDGHGYDNLILKVAWAQRRP